MHTSEPSKLNGRMTVVEQVYYQGLGAPHMRTGRCVHMLTRAGEVYERLRLHAEAEWVTLDTGWVKRVLSIRIENIGDGELEVGIGGMRFATLLPTDFIRISNPGDVQVRGATAYKLTVYPHA